MKVVLDDTPVRDLLFPFTLIRSAADIRIGILTIREKWEKLLGQPVLVKGEGYAQDIVPEDPGTVLLPANLLPSASLVEAIRQNNYRPGRAEEAMPGRALTFPWHIFEYNDRALRQDFEMLTRGRQSAPIPPGVQAVHPQDIFIEEGARLQHCGINAGTGPVYIAAGAEIMEGSMIRGPFALCEGAVVKMGARIYGATTIGPWSVAGGEIKNSVIFGYSNKAHDGYLGDAVIGEWCNLGAGTSNSNLKNNAHDVRVYHHPSGKHLSAGIKCGLLMGDYSRCAINSSFNTGTVTGVCANIFGEGLLPKWIPSFTWGSKGMTRYELDKALQDIAIWKQMKDRIFTDREKDILKTIFERL